ncbi:ATP-dependent sacrificial sulfur transferase LarE [Pelovirga terrestris]|uniref:ATP-dependent sacrificial sulfur transferase LarE n=1 Tax=Pelovirga terrestris TaxID=2771352 RepID=A0A8J6UR23_9BACT|nr:ATP-dependent sacrificial sulfur transferase LarE [Pelovirga terrestris]MBD1400381.1 ATP-dependent sacrificial sulfur transferase LarE [Pelovirga terrestris]
MTSEQKYEQLQATIAAMESVLVAFSGGVDSTFLLRVAVDVLGADRVLALTATSPTYPHYEFEESRKLAAAMGVRQLVVESNELKVADFTRNDRRRCYHCKSILFSLCRAQAAELGFSQVLDGSNLDDLDDFRPGSDAVKEQQILSPLQQAGLTKEDIRTLSRRLGLPTADKQAFACLSSRFPYGTELTPERLLQVERCEAFLRDQGFVNYRVRYHHDVARIEVSPSEVPRLLDPDLRDAVVAACKEAGFSYVALDLQGYRTGSMNEVLTGTA